MKWLTYLKRLWLVGQTTQPGITRHNPALGLREVPTLTLEPALAKLPEPLAKLPEPLAKLSEVPADPVAPLMMMWCSLAPASMPPDWRVRAERAAAILRGLASLCRVEMDKRKAVAAEQRRAHEEQNRLARAEQATLAYQRKVANIAASAVRESSERDAFIRHARALLPGEMFATIWAAVRAERGPAQDGLEIS